MDGEGGEKHLAGISPSLALVFPHEHPFQVVELGLQLAVVIRGIGALGIDGGLHGMQRNGDFVGGRPIGLVPKLIHPVSCSSGKTRR